MEVSERIKIVSIEKIYENDRFSYMKTIQKL